MMVMCAGKFENLSELQYVSGFCNCAVCLLFIQRCFVCYANYISQEA